jgi:predicted nucleic acid-binding protein
MRCVIDASVAFKWFVPEADDDKAMALLDSTAALVAPDLILAEVANAMWVRLRKLEAGPLAVAKGQQAMHRIFSDLVPSRELVARAAEITFAINVSVYDCVYLACCERENLVLTTTDQRLLGNVKGTPFEPLARALV